VDTYTCLTVDFARHVGAHVILRGLRVISDFELESKMALMNRKLAPEIDFITFMTSLEYSYLSASLLKEVAMLGGDLSGLVPQHVADALRHKLAKLGSDSRDRVQMVTLSND